MSAVLGVGCAWLVERTDLRGRGWWHGVMCAPLAVPAFVNGYGWVSTTHAVQSYCGRRAGRQPLLLPARLPADRGGAAPARPRPRGGRTSLGHGPVATFGRVVLPAISTGGPGRLAAGRAPPARRVRRPAAAQLPHPDHGDPRSSTRTAVQRAAGHPAGCRPGRPSASLLLGLELLLRAPSRPLPRGCRREPPGRADHTSAGGARSSSPSWSGLPRCRSGVPLVSLARWLIRGSSTAVRHRRPGRGHQHHSRPGDRVSGLVATAAALPVAWLAVRHRGWLTTLVERSAYTTSALPGIVVALALVTVSIRVVPAHLPDRCRCWCSAT